MDNRDASIGESFSYYAMLDLIKETELIEEADSSSLSPICAKAKIEIGRKFPFFRPSAQRGGKGGGRRKKKKRRKKNMRKRKGGRVGRKRMMRNKRDK